MITISNLSFQYDSQDRPALESISLEIRPGEFAAFLGENGSGKSTLARLINGILLPSQGSLQVDGLLTTTEAELQKLRRKVQMILQNPENQIVGSTVGEDVAFGLANIGFPRAEIERQVAWALELAGLSGREDDPVHTLSGGEKQKLAAASALALNPRYLILDEATAMLDPGARQQFLQTLRQIRRETGLGLIFITHHLKEVLDADRVYLFSQGRIRWQGPPRELVKEEALLAACGVELPFLPALSQRLALAGQPVDPLSTVEGLVSQLCS